MKYELVRFLWFYPMASTLWATMVDITTTLKNGHMKMDMTKMLDCPLLIEVRERERMLYNCLNPNCEEQNNLSCQYLKCIYEHYQSRLWLIACAMDLRKSFCSECMSSNYHMLRSCCFQSNRKVLSLNLLSFVSLQPTLNQHQRHQHNPQQSGISSLSSWPFAVVRYMAYPSSSPSPQHKSSCYSCHKHIWLLHCSQIF